MGSSAFPDALGYRNSATQSRIRQHQSKFVAAEARDHIGLPGTALNHCSGFDRCPAAGEVPVRIVDRFEAIQIDEEQRKWSSAASGALGFTAEDLIQVARIVELCQVVGDRERFDAL